MLKFLAIIVLAVITLLAIALQKAYTNIPRTELKRRAQRGDQFADLLYRAASYGLSLQIFMWAIIGLSAAGFFVMLTLSVPGWLALLGSLALLWFGFAWLPNTRVSKLSNLAARFLTPPIAWLLDHLYPLLNRIAHLLRKHTHIKVHSGLYEKEDLLALLDRQTSQAGNRLSAEELRIAAGALTFGDKLVRDVMTPRRIVKSVATTDAMGPHLMDELHASGHSRWPVYQDKPDNIVGMLYARDLMSAGNGGQVRDLMKKHVYYVHEEQSLSQVLGAFLKTKHHLFIVVNAFEEIVGIITIEDILEQILGKPIVDEFDKYDDMRAVAALGAKAEHKNQVPEETSADKP
ncbi:MAG TPA: CBS domain-containing protein [Patescibacteria group bacterium]|nr:CBS domain-containing protein [Patescibacteria group bacterium]